MNNNNHSYSKIYHYEEIIQNHISNFHVRVNKITNYMKDLLKRITEFVNKIFNILFISKTCDSSPQTSSKSETPSNEQPNKTKPRYLTKKEQDRVCRDWDLAGISIKI